MLLLFVFVFYILYLFHFMHFTIDCILFKCYLTGFDKINHDVHLECMSIVTDATQNQNGSPLTKSEIIGLCRE